MDVRILTAGGQGFKLLGRGGSGCLLGAFQSLPIPSDTCPRSFSSVLLLSPSQSLLLFSLLPISLFPSCLSVPSSPPFLTAFHSVSTGAFTHIRCLFAAREPSRHCSTEVGPDLQESRYFGISPLTCVDCWSSCYGPACRAAKGAFDGALQ